MLKPLIGVTVAHYSEELATFPREYYVQSIRLAGGIPVLIPPLDQPEEAEELFEKIDGIVLSGGGDISPVFLEELPIRGIKRSNPQRDISEILLATQALNRGIPLLGICRGIQVLAVAAGGKLYQDILTQYPGVMEHDQTSPREYPWHPVDLMESHLQEIIKEKKIMVNSFHHQAVSALPPGFITSALAPDGIIEGIEFPGAKFCIGVQWHPEAMARDSQNQKLFHAFIEACVHQ